jgi:hypothetical protein
VIAGVVKPKHLVRDKKRMAAESLKKLRAKASMALGNSEFEQALACYRELERREPENPSWCQLRAEIHAQQGLHTQAIKGFGYALVIALDAGKIIAAIAICKQILEIDPENNDALERLLLLYSESHCAEPTPARPATALRPEPAADDAPLEAVMLTEILSGDSPDVSSDLDQTGIIEISLVQTAQREPISPPSVDTETSARDHLLNTPLFGCLDGRSLSELIERVKVVSLDEGEVLFRQGDRADTLYVVADGAMVPIAEEDARKKLAVLKVMLCFLRDRLIDRLIPQTKCWVLALSRHRLQRLIANNLRAAAVIQQMADGRETRNANRNKTPVDQGGGGVS